MPYVKQERRLPSIEHPTNAGELNYALSMTIIKYVGDKGLSYATINDISGAMTEALAEFRRRVVAPYEDTKIAENGDLPYPEVKK